MNTKEVSVASFNLPSGRLPKGEDSMSIKLPLNAKTIQRLDIKIADLEAENARLREALKENNTALEGTRGAVVTHNQNWLDTYADQYLGGIIDRNRAILTELEG